MKYKGFDIKPSYVVGSNFKLLESGDWVDRKPTSKDIEYWEIIDLIDGSRFTAEATIKECKKSIDNLLIKMGMKDNTQKSWDSLDG